MNQQQKNSLEEMEFINFLDEHKLTERRQATLRLLKGDNKALYLAVLGVVPEKITPQTKLLNIVLPTIKKVHSKCGSLEWCKADACHILGHLTQTGYLIAHTNELKNGSYTCGSEIFYSLSQPIEDIKKELSKLN